MKLIPLFALLVLYGIRIELCVKNLSLAQGLKLIQYMDVKIVSGLNHETHIPKRYQVLRFIKKV
ncbi:hypothetical protein SAMN05421594_3121 [Chryseobacterium oleae]|uniref:Uncharacterized protein n=1 Tax=Chryseobacterium oleae TaxID=491207 RepID=A0A1I4ZNH8_CHROL|nr:hypothetical protein SAMN05421594_3121 [Chryseobacterium oleae]